MNRHDMGMIELRPSAFAHIEFGIGPRRDHLGMRNLDGHFPFELLVISQVHIAETSRTEEAADFVTSKPHGHVRRLRDGLE